MSPSTFRTALIFSIALAISSAVLEYLAQARLPATISDSISKLSDAVPLWKFAVAVVAGIASVLIGLISTFGLYCFKPWAPSLAINSTLLAGVALFFLPPALSHGASETLTMYSMTLWGAVLAFSKSDSYKDRVTQVRTEA